jgi:hypothetical protein
VRLASAGVEADHGVYFTTAAELAAKCHRAAIEGRWNSLKAAHGPVCDSARHRWHVTSFVTSRRFSTTNPRPARRTPQATKTTMPAPKE